MSKKEHNPEPPSKGNKPPSPPRPPSKYKTQISRDLLNKIVEELVYDTLRIVMFGCNSTYMTIPEVKYHHDYLTKTFEEILKNNFQLK